MTGLGNNIAIYRKRIGLTQEQLAEKCGVSRQAITKWEADSSEPDVSKICLLADLFGIEVDTLLGRETSSIITEKEERVFKRVALTIKGVYDDNDVEAMGLCVGLMNAAAMKYLNSKHEVYEQFLNKNTTMEQREEIAEYMCPFFKHLEDQNDMRPYEDYKNGLIEIDELYNLIFTGLNNRWNELMDEENTIRKHRAYTIYRKINGLLFSTSHKRLNEIYDEIDSINELEINNGLFMAIFNAFASCLKEAESKNDYEEIDRLRFAWGCLGNFFESCIKYGMD